MLTASHIIETTDVINIPLPETVLPVRNGGWTGPSAVLATHLRVVAAFLEQRPGHAAISTAPATPAQPATTVIRSTTRQEGELAVPIGKEEQ